uniref:Ribosomal RNA processing 1 n=1 Tax=Amphilophus citrinellus TaxID=61819 RepID=A0A3Q0SSL4_AMPCI
MKIQMNQQINQSRFQSLDDDVCLCPAVFSGEELLKLWKGLFYCLWMQDKPLLQEELSRQISTLIHGFHTTEQQLSYLQSFLQTMKREWTGIDQLRMDKFFQLVRFMFRQALEVLRRRSWDSSVVSQFLELLTAQLLQSDDAAPSGLHLHVLDLYLTELATVGAAELTADQNLTFVEPFCRTAARTKDSICSSVFTTIIDQAPFAIEDLMKEMKAAEDSDSGQASDEDDDESGEGETRKMEGGKKQVNGEYSPYDEDVGPVLQFDYCALADKLLEFSSQSGTPGPNRQRLYKIIKICEAEETIAPPEGDAAIPAKKKEKKKKKKKRVAAEGEAPSITADEGQAAEAPQLAKKMTKKKGKQEATTSPTPAETPQKKKKDQREAPEEEGHQEANAGTTPAKKKKKSRKQEAAQLEAGDTVDSNTEAAVKKKKKRKIPVVFEFEADELQAANGLAAAAEEETAAKKPRRTNVSVR